MVEAPSTTSCASCWICTCPCTSALDKVQEALSGTTTLVKVPVSAPVQAVLPAALSRGEKTPWSQSIPRTRSRLRLRSSTVRERDMVDLPPCRESMVVVSGLPGRHAPPGREPHADHDTPRPGAAMGAPRGRGGAHPPPVVDRAGPQPCPTLPPRHRPEPPGAGGCPPSRAGHLLYPASFLDVPVPVAAHGGIGIHSRVLPLEPPVLGWF